MKCKICGKQVTSQQVKDDLAIKVLYKDKNIYFCSSQHCKTYFDAEKMKQKNVEELNKIDNYIKNNIVYFNKMPVLPKQLYTRINDLYNGTSRTTNRQIKNGTGEGYPYQVILETFEEFTDTINFFLETKLSNAKESRKINYMMAIIENNINDIYYKFLSSTKETVDDKHESLVFYDDSVVIPTVAKKQNNNLLDFIDENDL